MNHTNIWALLNEIDLIATRHKRASGLKRYLLTDLEMIESEIEDFRKTFAVSEQGVQDN